MVNARHVNSRHTRNKKRDYLKDKINEHKTDTKNRNIRHSYRGINDNIHFVLKNRAVFKTKYTLGSFLKKKNQTQQR
jgi:hypothetical protein